MVQSSCRRTVRFDSTDPRYWMLTSGTPAGNHCLGGARLLISICRRPPRQATHVSTRLDHHVNVLVFALRGSSFPALQRVSNTQQHHKKAIAMSESVPTDYLQALNHNANGLHMVQTTSRCSIRDTVAGTMWLQWLPNYERATWHTEWEYASAFSC